MSELFYDDHTETYVLGNLHWRVITNGTGEFFGQYKMLSQKLIKTMNEADNAPTHAEPYVREICGKCGGYGGEQLHDGWFSCYACCEVGYMFAPLDLYLIEQLHLDALEDNYQHDLDMLPFDTGDPRMLMSKDDIAETLGTLVAGEIDRLARLKEDDDIPF